MNKRQHRRRAMKLRRARLRAMRRGGYNLQRVGQFVTPHGTMTIHDIPKEARR